MARAAGGSVANDPSGDKGCDTRDFIASCRALRITPHTAQDLARPGGSALDPRTVCHPDYSIGGAEELKHLLDFQSPPFCTALLGQVAQTPKLGTEVAQSVRDTCLIRSAIPSALRHHGVL
jgi:hypothetical protein